jgi:DnaK suppressor protein
LKENDLKHFEERLLEERNRLLSDMVDHTDSSNLTQRDASGDLSAYSFHMADLGTDAMEREKRFLFASRDTRLLYHIDQALERVHQGTYGMCESCGLEIAHGRLEVVPHARLCLACKEKEEKEKKEKR